MFGQKVNNARHVKLKGKKYKHKEAGWMHYSMPLPLNDNKEISTYTFIITLITNRLLLLQEDFLIKNHIQIFTSDTNFFPILGPVGSSLMYLTKRSLQSLQSILL